MNEGDRLQNSRDGIEGNDTLFGAGGVNTHNMNEQFKNISGVKVTN